MTIELKVPNMACPKGYRFAYGACAKSITQAVIELDPKASVKADPKTKQVIVNTKVSESSVKDAIAAAGYPAAQDIEHRALNIYQYVNFALRPYRPYQL